MVRQRQPKDGNYQRVMINMPTDLYEFVKVASHSENLSMSAYLVKLVAEKKNEILSKKS
jgi:hypothetical protein